METPAGTSLANSLARHRKQTRRKRRHRQLLARKHEVGAVRALVEQARRPVGFPRLLTDLVGDKLRSASAALLPGAAPSPRPMVRFLL